MFAIPGISCLLLLILSRAMPESPRWLAGKGRDAEADAIVTKFEGDKRGVISSDRQTVLAPPAVADDSNPPRFKYAMRLVVACLILIAANAGTYLFMQWLPTILLAEIGRPSCRERGCQYV